MTDRRNSLALVLAGLTLLGGCVVNPVPTPGPEGQQNPAATDVTTSGKDTSVPYGTADTVANADIATMDAGTADAPLPGDVTASACAGEAPTCWAQCGGDAGYGPAVCSGGTWTCVKGVLKADCPKDICWGLWPPGYVCENGEMKCPANRFRNPVNQDCVKDGCEVRAASVASAVAGLLGAWDACTSDADCAAIDTSTACHPTCGAGIAAANAGVFTAQITKLDAALCTGFEAKCGLQPIPPCLPPNPACEAGHCVRNGVAAGCSGVAPAGSVCQSGKWVCAKGYFAAKADGSDCKPYSCDAVKAESLAQTAALLAGQGACQVDADCALVGTFTCFEGPCWAGVKKASAAAAQAGMDAIDKTLCKDAGGWECKGPHNCPDAVAVCDQGSCAVK